MQAETPECSPNQGTVITRMIWEHLVLRIPNFTKTFCTGILSEHHDTLFYMYFKIAVLYLTLSDFAPLEYLRSKLLGVRAATQDLAQNQ